MTEWKDFWVTVGGSAAALTGLIFVGVSISLQKILSNPQLPSRAIQSLILLLTVLVIAILNLIPRQLPFFIGSEVLFIGIIVWVVTLRSDLKVLPKITGAEKKYIRQNILLTQLAVMPYIISGIVILLKGTDYGFYCLAPGIILCFIKAVLDAWVLLVEIYR
jgi:hypothetical protein